MSSITRYLGDLIDTYELIERRVPVTEDIRRSRKGIYRIRNPIMAFWFRYIHKNLTLFEGKNFNELKDIIKNDLSKYHGRRFEEISKEFLIELNNRNMFVFTFSKIGNWWGAARDETGRSMQEIDLITIEERTVQILFCECKWQDLKLKDANSILETLREKSKFVNWNNANRKEYFGLVARSIQGKNELKDRGFVVFDLGDFCIEVAE